MDKIVETSNVDAENTPPLPLNQTENQIFQSPIRISGQIGTPDRLKVPKAFKYPERYTSPTDQIMSPVTRRILARNRKNSKLFPPSANHPKIQALQVLEIGSLPNQEN